MSHCTFKAQILSFREQCGAQNEINIQKNCTHRLGELLEPLVGSVLAAGDDDIGDFGGPGDEELISLVGALLIADPAVRIGYMRVGIRFQLFERVD